MTEPLLRIENVSFAYNGQPVLEDVSLNVYPSDFIAIIGPNGGGKTTLVKLILGLLKPFKGAIRLMGDVSFKTSHLVGYVPQDVHINRRFPITALDVVRMGAIGRGTRRVRPGALDRGAAMAALERMDISHLADRRIGALSGGERQRVFIARALVTDPVLLLLDEPTASIDARGQADFFNLLKRLNEQTAILLVSHDLMAISTHVKSVACVNRRLYYHNEAEITGDMLHMMYPHAPESVCPVELVAHGLPHRVLQSHDNGGP